MGRTALVRGVGVLRERDFRRFYVGYATSMLGTSMWPVAVTFAVLGGGGSATDLGLVLAAGPACQLVFMLVGGVAADRIGPRHILLAGNALCCLAQFAFAAALFTSNGIIWLLVLLAAVRGIGEAFSRPGLSALVVKIAPRERLGDANALLGLAQSTARVAGPALAGVLVALTNAGMVIAVGAASFLCSLTALAILKVDMTRGPRGPIRREVVEGWVEFRSRKWLIATTIQFTVINVATWAPFLVLGPTLLYQADSGARDWGFIMAAYGAGSIAGGLFALGRRPRRPLIVATIATLGYAVPCAILAAQAPVLLVAVGALLAGVGSSVSIALSDTATQQHTPENVLARVRSFQSFGAFSLGPIAFAVAGPVAAVVGEREVLIVGAVLAVLGSSVVSMLPSIRSIKWASGVSDKTVSASSS